MLQKPPLRAKCLQHCPAANDRSRRSRATRLRPVAEGRSGALVLTGEPGIGKTTLLRRGIAAAARDVRVERIAAAESEMELSYAGLHLLCGRVAEDMDRLHPPQQEALEAAFGLRPVEAPSPFLVGLAVSRSWPQRRPNAR